MFPEAVSPRVLDVADRLGPGPRELGFYLAGGTALALQIGHRESIDLDFFTPNPFPGQAVTELLVGAGGEVRVAEVDTVHGTVSGVKVSFFSYPYPLLVPLIPFRELLLADVPDVAAMKTTAIAQRGTKKDFFDAFHILQLHSPDQVKGWVLAKFGEARVNCYHVLRSLFFFEDAENDPEPMSRTGTRWSDVKAWFLANERALFDSLLSEAHCRNR
jgi:hypothetical protein